MAALYTPGGGTIPTSVKEKPIYLVRWEWVKTARVYKKKPPQGKPKSYGFVLPTDPKP
jgi:hypothetical protein